MADIADDLEAAADRFADGLLAATDLEGRAGTLEWTRRQVGAHLAVGAEAYAAMAAGEPTPLVRMADRAGLADRLIGTVAGVPVDELAARVRSGSQRLAGIVRKAGDGPLPFYEHELPATDLGALFLAELLVHGHDLGALPIPPAAAARAVLAVPAVLPFVVVPDGRPRRASIAFRARGHGESVVEVDGDRARLRAPGERAPVDARMSGEPVTLLLAAYQRLNPLRAMVTGKLAVTGRRPWRLRALQTRFETA